METAEYDVQDFNERYAADKSVYARFYTMPVKDEHASANEGRPIFYDKEYIEIRAAGNQNNIVQRPSMQQDRERFSRQYAAFKQGNSEQVVGTPLTEVTWLTRSQVEELAYVRIRTLEHLSSVSDDICSKMPGLQDLKRKAAQVLEAAEAVAPITALQEENEGLKAQVAALTNQVKELTAAMKKAEK
jgi:hypothetical protein